MSDYILLFEIKSYDLKSSNGEEEEDKVREQKSDNKEKMTEKAG